MKKVSKVLVIMLVLALMAAMVGCGSTESPATDAPKATEATSSDYAKTEYNLVFIPKLVHQWYEDVKIGIEKAIVELAEQGITVNYTWDAPSDAIVTEQIAKLEAAATNNPDGISVAILDPAAETSIIKDMIAQGFKISTFDCDAPDSGRFFFCGHTKDYEDGVIMADILAKEMDEKGEVAVLAGSLSAKNHQDRVKGFIDGIAKYANITVVDTQADEDTIETAISVTESYLTAYPNLKAIFGCNDAAPIGAVRAVKDADRAGEILIVGFADNQEAFGYIKDGSLLSTMKQDVPSIGYHSVFNMLRVADGKAPEMVEYEMDAIFITIDDVDNYLD